MANYEVCDIGAPAADYMRSENSCRSEMFVPASDGLHARILRRDDGHGLIFLFHALLLRIDAAGWYMAAEKPKLGTALQPMSRARLA